MLELPENESRPRLVRLLERERALSVPKLKLLRPLEREPDEPVELELLDADDARRRRCMRVGSTSGRFASRAKSERTARVGQWGVLRLGKNIPSTVETIPVRLPVLVGGNSSVTKTRCEDATTRSDRAVNCIVVHVLTRSFCMV